MKKKALALVVCMLLTAILTGCAKLRSGIHDLHGTIIGNEYIIDIFDNTGIRTMKSHGKRIDIDNNVVEEKSYSSVTDEWFTTKTQGPSSKGTSHSVFIRGLKSLTVAPASL